MKKFFSLFFSFTLFACSNVTATPTVTATPQAAFTSTPTSTCTPSPTLTATATFTLIPDTATPDTVTPPIETVPFNEKTYKNLPQLDVAAWEAEAGRVLTPKDIIEASKLGEPTPFPSDALVVGFWAETTQYGSVGMRPIVDVKVGADKLPMTYEAVMLINAERMIPDEVHATAKKEGWTADKLIAMVWRVKTPSGELIGVMLTDGELVKGEDGAKNLSQDFLEGTGIVNGKEDWTMTPMIQMPTVKGYSDVMGSVTARKMWGKEKVMQGEIQEAMAGADLTDKEDLEKLQALLDENWLFMGGTVDKTIKVK